MSGTGLTDEQLEAAYRVVSSGGWPNLHELKLAAARYKLVEGYAQRRASGAFSTAAQTRADDSGAFGRAACYSNVNPPAPAQRPPVPPAPPRTASPFIDRKQAASGEREE